MLVIESGGSKSTWGYQNESQVEIFETSGLHPFELTDLKYHQISKRIANKELNLINSVYFYGAGCESIKGQENITAFFKKLGLHAPIIHTDLLAACIATWGKQEGATAILGTGAISAYYNGKKIIKKASGLGYMLGDEGSGYDLGKRLLVSYFKEELPEDLAEQITHHFGSKQEIIEKVYCPTGRKTVAELTRIIYDFKHYPIVEKIIAEAFHAFVDSAIIPLGTPTTLKTVGSIGFYFKNELQNVLNHYEITLLETLESAHEKLFEFHRKK